MTQETQAGHNELRNRLNRIVIGCMVRGMSSEAVVDEVWDYLSLNKLIRDQSPAPVASGGCKGSVDEEKLRADLYAELFDRFRFTTNESADYQCERIVREQMKHIRPYLTPKPVEAPTHRHGAVEVVDGAIVSVTVQDGSSSEPKFNKLLHHQRQKAKEQPVEAQRGHGIISCYICGEKNTVIVGKDIFDTHTVTKESYYCFRCDKPAPAIVKSGEPDCKVAPTMGEEVGSYAGFKIVQDESVADGCFELRHPITPKQGPDAEMVLLKVKESMQEWINYHCERADKAEAALDAIHQPKPSEKE